MFLTLVLTSLIILSNSVSCVQLDNDGYYDIVIAVNEKTIQNGNEDYLEHLKISIQDLGDAIWESTKGKFALRSADILLPNHWETNNNETISTYATTQSYQTADIRISHEFLIPQTVNPLACSYPGNWIEVPYSFFDEPDKGPFGPTGKALLTLWARYRWGVHEEHGFPGDSQFPYYWRKMRLPDDPRDLEENWIVSECADKEVKGEFRKLNGKGCEEEDDDDDDTATTSFPPPSTTEEDATTTFPGGPELYPPKSDCLFFPEIYNQEVSTSLMSFTFIQSLKNFCDEETHNRRAPTRQNHFCHFQSIWEVILKSPDYLKIKDSTLEKEKNAVEFRFLKKTEKPLLYILSEGVNIVPQEVIDGVADGIEELFNGTEHWNVLTEVGVFPGADWKDSFQTVYSWELPWYNVGRLRTSFEGGFRSKMGFRNFGAAIHDIGNRIKEKNHEAGAVLLILKYGSEPEVDDKGNDVLNRKFFQTFEGEVVATLLESNIRVFALEGMDEQAESAFPYRLKHICEVSGGEHFTIAEDDLEENDAAIKSAMSAIDETLKIPSSLLPKYVVYKMVETAEIYNDKVFPININYGNVKGIRFYFHQLSSELGMGIMDPPEFTEGPEPSNLPMFSEYDQWGKYEDAMKSYYAEFDQELEDPSSWEYNLGFLGCQQLICNSLMIAIAEVAEDPSPNQEIFISISTSADEDDSVIDFTQQGAASLKGTAFSIYAKLEKKGHPINNPKLEVKAHVIVYFKGDDVDGSNFGQVGDAVVINLEDRGLQTPDVTGNDGIFSGNYILSPDYMAPDSALFQVFVTAELKPEESKSLKTTEAEDEFYSLPTRCGSGWGGCWSETVSKPFMVYADLKRRFEFRGTRDYETLGSAFRISDLRVEQARDLVGGQLLPEMYNLVFTEPFIPRSLNAQNKVDLCQVLYTENVNHIVDPSQNQFLTELLEQPVTGSPGKTLTFLFPEKIEAGKKIYFVVQAWGKDKQVVPGYSNIAFLQSSDPYIIPTTTTSTTTEPPSTLSTSPLPSKEPGTTTPPSRTTITEGTTPTTTWATPSSTRRTTTTTSTTPPTTSPRTFPTTERPKRWYETTGAIVTYSVFGALFVLTLGGFFVYFRFFKKDNNYQSIIE